MWIAQQEAAFYTWTVGQIYWLRLVCWKWDWGRCWLWPGCCRGDIDPCWWQGTCNLLFGLNMLELTAYIGFAQLCQGVVKTGLCIAIPEVQENLDQSCRCLAKPHWARASKSYFWDLPGHIRTSGSSLWFGSEEDAAQTQSEINTSEDISVKFKTRQSLFVSLESQAPHWSRGCGLRLQRGGKYFPRPECMTKELQKTWFTFRFAGRGSPFQSRSWGQSRVCLDNPNYSSAKS